MGAGKKKKTKATSPVRWFNMYGRPVDAAVEVII
jgi:hypothetical protein